MELRDTFRIKFREEIHRGRNFNLEPDAIAERLVDLVMSEFDDMAAVRPQDDGITTTGFKAFEEVMRAALAGCLPLCDRLGDARAVFKFIFYFTKVRQDNSTLVTMDQPQMFPSVEFMPNTVAKTCKVLMINDSSKDPIDPE